MFAVLLRQQGYFVEYLGPDLPTEDLIDYSIQVRPKLICLTISQEDTAYLLKGFAAQLASLRGKPKFAYSGRFIQDNVELQNDLGGIYLGDTLGEGLEKVKQLIAVS